MSFTNRGDGQGRHAAPDRSTIASIPLSDVDVRVSGQESIGSLVRDATTQMSTLVRAEVELAKAEVTDEVKKGLQGSVLFIVALTVLLFSSFFFFFFLAELLDTWVWRWLAFLIVFLIMLVITGVFALLGYLRVRRLRAPSKTIDSLKAARTVLPVTKSDAPQWSAASPSGPAGKHAAEPLNR